MTKWEYRERNPSDTMVLKIANSIGEEGWELCASYKTDRDEAQGLVTLIFKRPIEGEK